MSTPRLFKLFDFGLSMALISLLPLVVTAIFATPLLEDLKSLSWTKAPAKITQSSLRIASVRRTRKIIADIRYEYHADGTTFESARFASFGACGRGFLADPHEAVRKFPTGSNAFVYYNPGQPAEAMLAPGFHATHWLATAAVGFSLAIIIGGIRQQLRHPRKKSSKSN
ncbi:MAG: DUF3592 domain-containing protein [Verrucomicrobia bacterium]|nr:DUF3592 domain-containing protein [Verrucomicrobiota bacterium]